MRTAKALSAISRRCLCQQKGFDTGTQKSDCQVGGRGDGGTIKRIHARQIYDSRGNPTVEVDLQTEKGIFRAAVPSGASTGVHEAVELRDNDISYHGKSVFKAIDNVNKIIAPKLIEARIPVVNQYEIDRFMVELDGTENKSKLGANAILGVSIAVTRAGAAEKSLPLYRYIAQLAENQKLVMPVPSFNVINGGEHAGNKLAFQEFMIMPTGASCFADAMKMGSETYHHLKNVIKEKYGKSSTSVGDEGGFAPDIAKPEEALDMIKTAIERSGHTGKIDIAMDPATSELYRDGKYDMDFKNPLSNKSQWLTKEQLLEEFLKLIKNYPIVSIEDPFEQDDWEGWSMIMKKVQIQIVGDDATVTNVKRIKKAIDLKAANALLLKVNQVGTITESIDAHKMVKAAGWGTMVSHRSGETEDPFIADLAVGLSSGQIKAGAPTRSERLCKYTQLLRIEEDLGSEAIYAGKNFRHPHGNGPSNLEFNKQF